MTRIVLVGALVAMNGSSAVAEPVTCAPCHQRETARFAESGMAQALQSAKNSAILRTNPKLTTKIGEYSYEISRAGDDSIYTVTDGKQTMRLSLEWAFGQGTVGQTYLFQREGNWYESRVSYYSALRGLDATMGMQTIPVRNLEEATGRLIAPEEAKRCLDCHATNIAKTPRLTLSGMIEGVQCERCHGASDDHVKAVRSGDVPRGAMRKLGAFTSEEMSEFCGQCHRTWSQIATNGPRGVLNVRFQPYRLALSKCYDPEDRRIRCTACHDPHRDVETSVVAYDSKCLACHSSSSSPVTVASKHICRVATKDCVTCHMAKVDLPEAHKKFTDHNIRIVRANEKYPD